MFPKVRRYHINADLTVEAQDADEAMVIFQNATEFTNLTVERADIEEEDA